MSCTEGKLCIAQYLTNVLLRSIGVEKNRFLNHKHLLMPSYFVDIWVKVVWKRWVDYFEHLSFMVVQIAMRCIVLYVY